MRGVALWCQWRIVFAPAILGALASGCVSVSDGPARLYTVPEETQQIRDQLQQLNLVQYSSMDEPSRRRLRNDWIGARMYAIDIQYTPYEAALTKERQGVGFGAAATTIALTTASGLVTPVATKNVLTGLAGFVTGARAAYDSDILLAHSVQWIQTQMEANRADISSRILKGMKLSTTDYPLAAALSDLEAYYRAGTFTGGLLATGQVIATDAKEAAVEKVEVQGLGPDSSPIRSSALTGSQQQIPENKKRRTDPGPEILDPFEGSLTAPAVREIQQALCIKPTGSFGPKDSATRRAIADYLGGRGKTVSQIVDQRNFTFLDEAVEKVDVRNGGTCAKKNFANAMAVGNSFPR